MELPIQLAKLLEDLADPTQPIHIRLNYRQRVAGISQELNKALIRFDQEYAFETERKR